MFGMLPSHSIRHFLRLHLHIGCLYVLPLSISPLCLQFGLKIYDNYADNNGTYWSLCELPTYDENSDIDPYVMPSSPIHITSYLNTLHIRQKTTLNLNYLKLNATIRIQPGE